MHEVKCKTVIMSPFWSPHKDNTFNIIGRHTALRWVKLVGFDHVRAGLCEYTKCIRARKHIDSKHIILDPVTNRPVINPLDPFFPVKPLKP